jgi:hypothetical protein
LVARGTETRSYRKCGFTVATDGRTSETSDVTDIGLSRRRGELVVPQWVRNNGTLSRVKKLRRLMASAEGDPTLLLQSIVVTDANYIEA